MSFIPFALGALVGGLLPKDEKPADSKVTITDKKYYINKNNVDVLNKNIVDTLANTVMKSAQECASTSAGSQIINVKNIDTSGDFVFNGSQNLNTKLNFSCKQSADIKLKAAQDIYSQLVSSLNQSNDSKVLSELESEAASKLNSGFGSFGDKATSSTDTNIDYKIESENSTKLQNVVARSIVNNFSTEDIKDCTARLLGDQAQNFDTIKAKNVTINTNQDMSLDSLASCDQFQEAANDITNKITDVLGVVVTTKNTSETDTKVKTKVYSDTVAKGPFESIGEGIGAAARGIGEGFGSFFSAMLSPYAISSCVICIICIIILCVLFFMFGGIGGGGSSSSLNRYSSKFRK